MGNPGAGLVSSHPFALREAWQLSSTGMYYLQEMATHWKERENEYCLTHTTTAVEDAALLSTALTPKLLVLIVDIDGAVQFLYQLRRDAELLRLGGASCVCCCCTCSTLF